MNINTFLNIFSKKHKDACEIGLINTAHNVTTESAADVREGD